jgi:cytochrome c biogenesis protein CcmG/thiol:disulfide interchange protein DsbE
MAALALVGLLTFGLLSKGDSAIAQGEPLPAFELPPLGESASGASSVADYRGEWVLVNVWASWCEPCREESPTLERFWRKHRGDGVVVLGIDTQDNTSDALEFIDEFSLTYPQLHDGSGDVHTNELKMTGVPETVLIDPEGDVALHWPGPIDERILRERFEPLIEAGT